MKQVAILVPQDAVLPSIVDAHTMFTGVNAFLKAAGKSPLYNIQLVGITDQIKFHTSLFSIQTDALVTEVNQADLIIIPAIGGDFATTLENNKAFVPWIVQQYEQGAEVTSLCTGAFLLAYTGLLNGKECSCHWNSAGLFREMFPEVTLVDGRIVTEQQRLYSSGGATSYWNLLLHLVEKTRRTGDGHNGRQNLRLRNRPEKSISFCHVQWAKETRRRTYQASAGVYRTQSNRAHIGRRFVGPIRYWPPSF